MGVESTVCHVILISPCDTWTILAQWQVSYFVGVHKLRKGAQSCWETRPPVPLHVEGNTVCHKGVYVNHPLKSLYPNYSNNTDIIHTRSLHLLYYKGMNYY